MPQDVSLKQPSAPPPRPVSFTNNDDDLGVALNFPFTLLPLRIETRFASVDDKPYLWIRIYPDQIAIDSFDPRLTTSELADAIGYAQKLAPCANDDLATQQAAWQFLAGRYGPKRAAYLADAVFPSDQLANWLAATPGVVAEDVPGAQFSTAVLSASLATLGCRSSSFAKAPMARCLPTRWLVYGTSNVGEPLAYEIKRPINNDLPVGPSGEPVVPANTPGGAAVDPAMLWLVDFQAAVKAGMAAILPLSEAQAREGFNNLYVVGIYDQAPGTEQVTLEQLLTAHRFSDGWAIIPQGTPTKSSSGAPSGYSSSDPNFAISFDAERQVPLSQPAPSPSPYTPDGLVLANALGLAPESVAHLQGTAGTNQYDATCMATALWPVTIGYYLQFITQYGGTLSALATEIHDAFLGLVRGRGPVPAISVGNVPYGILPTAPISQLLSVNDPDDPSLTALLSGLWHSWLQGEQNYLGKCDTDDAMEMAAVADLTPSSTTYTLTNMAGQNTFEALLAVAPGVTGTTLQQEVVGFCAGGPEGGGINFLNATNSFVNWTPVAPDQWLQPWETLARFPLPIWNGTSWVVPAGAGLVATVVDDAAPTAENPSETMNYLQRLYQVYANSGQVSVVRDLINEAGTGLYNSFYDSSMMYILLRGSVLTSLALACAQLGSSPPPGEPELVDFSGEEPIPTTTLQRLVTWGGGGASEALFAVRNSPLYNYDLQAADDFFNIGPSLQRLSYLPSSELQRLFTETLDCAQGRVDAWLTALATSRLSEYPRDTLGRLLGAYGWLQNVVPDATPGPSANLSTLEQAEKAVAGSTSGTPVAVNDVRGAEVGNGGFVFAPSLNQAATAAILRNADLTNKDAAELGIPLDLSSTRVRNALRYFDGVRQGASLGALMGERAEEALADANLSAYIQPLRNTFPLVANKLTTSSGSQPPSSFAAPDVVDGVALEQAIATGAINWAQVVSTSGAVLSAVQANSDATQLGMTLSFLEDDMAAIADISTSETIFQIVRGNPERAGSILDALQAGAQIPEPQVAETPRTGLAVTQRLLTVGGVDPAKAVAFTSAGTPRAAAEPWLESWLASLLPSPETTAFSCEYSDPDISLTMTVADLGLSALDLLAFATTPDASLSSDLADYVLYTAQTMGAPLHPGLVTVDISNTGTSPGSVSLGRVLPVLQAARDVIARSRVLTVEDLAATNGDQASGIFFQAELQDRVNALGKAFDIAVAQLDRAIGSFDPQSATSAQVAALSKAMVGLSAFGIPQAIPPVVLSPAYAELAASHSGSAGANQAVYASLAAQATTVLGQAQGRAAKFSQAVAAGQTTVSSLTVATQAILGTSFVVVPLLPGTAAADFLTSTTDWVNGFNGADDQTLCGIMQQLTHVRSGVASLDLLRTGAAIARQSTVTDFVLGQVAYDSAIPWLALPVQPHDAGSWPSSWLGKASLIAWLPSAVPASSPYVCGLVFDEWTELIPSRSEKAAIAFNYPDPLSKAPQAILMALADARVVRPRVDQAASGLVVGADSLSELPGAETTPQALSTWNYQTLLQIIEDTFALLKARVTDPASVPTNVPGVSRLFIPRNTSNDTITILPY